jgi:hypothetical protein
MDVTIGTEAANSVSGNTVYVSNFRYCVFVVVQTIHHNSTVEIYVVIEA